MQEDMDAPAPRTFMTPLAILAQTEVLVMSLFNGRAGSLALDSPASVLTCTGIDGGTFLLMLACKSAHLRTRPTMNELAQTTLPTLATAGAIAMCGIPATLTCGILSLLNCWAQTPFATEQNDAVRAATGGFTDLREITGCASATDFSLPISTVTVYSTIVIAGFHLGMHWPHYQSHSIWERIHLGKL